MKLKKGRVEAFSDGVIAIIVTIMVLNIPVPEGFGRAAMLSLLGSIAVYFVSFFIVGFFWHQHYVLFHRVEEVSWATSWRNLLFLFLLSLLPIFTKWVIANPGEVVPCIGYVAVFISVTLSYQFMLFGILKGGEVLNVKRAHRPRFLLFVAIWLVLILGVVALSLFQPFAASVLLIGLPLVFAFGNIFFEREKGAHVRRRLGASQHTSAESTRARAATLNEDEERGPT